MFLKAFLLFFVLICVTNAGNDCMDGPSYWCKSDKNAKECGVQLFCNAMKGSQEKITFHPKEEKKVKKPVLDGPPVNVSFYYESLCPGCREVWKDQLYPTYQKLASSGIVNFFFVPYGNAQEQQSGNQWIFYCQHGAAECTGNLIESCAINYYPDEAIHIPFLHCLEYYGPTETNAKYCASLNKMDATKILTCSQDSLGNSLEHQMALKTEGLNPPHQYVPWLTLNGQHTSAIQNGLTSEMLQTVCNAFTGTKPAACNQAKDIPKCHKNF